jgi:hypothetical protein
MQVNTLTIPDMNYCYSGSIFVEVELPSEVIRLHFALALLGGGTTVRESCKADREPIRGTTFLHGNLGSR